MNDTIMSRHQSRPHYAKVIAMTGAIWVAISLFMPIVKGPFGMQASGWQLLSDQAPMVVVALMCAVMVGMLGLYLICSVIAGGLSIVLIGKLNGVMAALGSNGLVGDQQVMADAMGAMLSAQVGLTWGAPMVVLGIIAMLTCRLFYHQ